MVHIGLSSTRFKRVKRNGQRLLAQVESGELEKRQLGGIAAALPAFNTLLADVCINGVGCPLSNVIAPAPATSPPVATIPATTPAFTPQAPAFTPQSTPAPAPAPAASAPVVAEPVPAQSAPVAPVVVASTAPAASNNNNNNEVVNNNANVSSAQAAPANNNQAATPAQTAAVNNNVNNQQAQATPAPAVASQIAALQSQAAVLNNGGAITLTDSAGSVAILVGSSAAANLGAQASAISAAVASSFATRSVAPSSTSRTLTTVSLLTTTDSAGRTITSAKTMTVVTPVPIATITAEAEAQNSINPQGSSKVPIGGIAGGVVGAVLIGLVVWLLIRRKRGRQARSERVAAAAALAIAYDTRGNEKGDDYQSRSSRHNSSSNIATRPPSPVFDSFPVTFRSRDEEVARPNQGFYADDNGSDSDNQMENLAGSMNDIRRSSFDQFRGRRVDANGQRLGYLSMDSTAMDSILDSATDTSSIFSESDPAAQATFGNLTRLENPYSRRAVKIIPQTTVTAPSLNDTELIYAAPRPSLVNPMNRRISTGSRVTFNEVNDSEDEFVEVSGQGSMYASTAGRTRSSESFNTAHDGRTSPSDQEFDDESVSSGGGHSTRGLILQRRADTVPRR